jgi:hypothetical protein
MWNRVTLILEIGLILIAGALCMTSSAPRAGTEVEKVEAFTRGIQFDYVGWMLDAAGIKAEQNAAGVPGYLGREQSQVAVSDFLHITSQIMRAEDALNRIYSDPSVPDKQRATAHIHQELAGLQASQRQVAPLAEAVLQAQVGQVAADKGLTMLGAPVPAVLFHVTAVPDALIISPRQRIEEIANISITPGLAVDRQDSLERQVKSGLDVSALVVPIGGVGIYPTMIMQTTDLKWLTSTVAHEWTHNFLELRPLGLLYDKTPQLRTMNETTADIVGTEIGQEVVARYYPQVSQASLDMTSLISLPYKLPDPSDADSAPFDFRAEMHATRIVVDAMLASGKIDEAERYMEQRRQIFVKNGFYIRKLNQAYFAFYGAYADIPGGPAGEDPVGPAVRALRARSRSLADFVNTIAWMTSFQQLQAAVSQ